MLVQYYARRCVDTTHTHIDMNISKCDGCRALHICRDQVDNICPDTIYMVPLTTKNGHLIASSQNGCWKYRIFKLDAMHQCKFILHTHTHTFTKCIIIYILLNETCRFG